MTNYDHVFTSLGTFRGLKVKATCCFLPPCYLNNKDKRRRIWEPTVVLGKVL